MIVQIEMTTKPEWVGETVTTVHAKAQVITDAVKRNEAFISPPPAELTLQTDDI